MNLAQKNIIAAAILFITSIFIYLLIINPTIKDIRVFNDRIQIERVSLENKYTSRRNIKNIIADLKYVTDKLTPLFEKIIIKKGSEVEFISGLEKLAKNNALVQKIQISSAMPGDKDRLAQKKNISISLSGDYVNVVKYLEELEKSDYYVIINSLVISSGKSSATKTTAASAVVKTNLQGYVYFSI